MEDSSTSRLRLVSDGGTADGKCVVYVMSRDQRVRDNHALLIAQKDAITHGLPLAVVFCLRPGIGKRAREHYQWMLIGLKEIEQKLEKLNIPFILLLGDTQERLMGFIRHTHPRSVYFDMSPLKGPRHSQKKIAHESNCQVYFVDTHNIIPVWEVSDKQEYAARTIRPKIHKKLMEFVVEPDDLEEHPVPWPGRVIRINELQDDIAKLIDEVPSNGQTGLTELYPSGNDNARAHLADFLENKLSSYAITRNDPSVDGLSGLSPYLHFGRISSLRVLLEARDYAGRHPEEESGLEALIEEMVVRKELSDNFCYYNSEYDNLRGAADWARLTLEKHKTDEREYIYTLKDFEHAKTHDSAWNSAQIQLLKTGKIHGYMRMYWAKKVLEWSASPEEAHQTLVYLNDFYSIDGGDPNGYVGILWSIAGLHDRPWGERQVYGTIRSMVYGGLKRKFDINAYETRWLV